ncbi:MAG: hypothetical protein HC874_27525 [Richelia sp. SL_2_1]|nr:hypothetical protein [Richelia sp. SL_2_1]
MSSKKYCKHCDNYKDINEFYISRVRKSGIDTYCIDCNKQRTKNVKDKRRSNNLCIVCGIELTTSKKYCDVCLHNKYVYHKKFIKTDLRRKLIYNTKKNAKERNIYFDLVIDDIIIPEYCPVLGIKLNFNNQKSMDDSPSIDRIDSNKGYIKDNIMVISFRANRGKNNLTAIEHLKIYHWMIEMENK